jgi:hypothetical protein
MNGSQTLHPDTPSIKPKRKGLEREFALLRAENLVKDFVACAPWMGSV